MAGSDVVAFIAIGDEVFAADGDKVGNVADVQPGYFVVAGGFVFPSDTVIPISAITSAASGRITLAAAKDEALEVHVASTSDSEIIIPLAEETLTAATRPVAGGAVRITKRVVSVDQGHDLAASDDEIRVERHIVDRPGATGERQSFEQIIIEVPLERDVGDGRQQAQLTEEIVVTKETVQRTERVTGTVRREEIFIDGDEISGDDRQDDSVMVRNEASRLDAASVPGNRDSSPAGSA